MGLDVIKAHILKLFPPPASALVRNPLIIKRLKQLDVIERWRPLPPVVSQIAFSLACCSAMMCVRFCIDLIAPGAGPFALIFPAIMVATIFGRALAGLLTLTLLMLYAWYAVLLPYTFVFVNGQDKTRTIVNACSGALIVLLAELVRRAFHKAVDQRDEKIAEQELLLRELDHRIKNNFAQVSGLLAIQRRQAKDDATRLALGLAEARVQGIARANQHLYGGSLISTEVDMRSYIHGLCAALSDMISASQDIKIECNSVSVSIDRDRAIAVGLIINELVTNALKHAFPNGASGLIKISLEDDHDGYRLTVQDNGVGMSDNVREGALGQRLIQAFVQQAKARLTVTSGTGGTAFVVALPA